MRRRAEGSTRSSARGLRRDLCQRPEPRRRHYAEVLGEAQFWWDKHGRRHVLTEMSLAYLLNLLSFLERRGPHWYRAAQLAEAWEDLDAELDIPYQAPSYEEALAWLHEQPVWRALVAQASARVFVRKRPT